MSFYKRIAALVRRRRLGRELADEIDLHIELRRQSLVEGGMDPGEAWFEARRSFGNPSKFREESRDMWGFPSIDTLLQDVRFGARLLRRSPMFTAVAVLSLAIGIGASTAVFGLADALLLRKLPVRDPDSLVALRWHSGPAMPFASLNGNGSQGPDGLASTSFSMAAFDAMREAGARDVELFGFADLYRVNITIDGRADLGFGHAVSGGYFPVLGIPAAVGRTILPSDDSDQAPPVAVVGHSLWTRQFHRSPDVVGKPLVVNGLPFTIVGVMPAGFRGTGQVDDAPELYVPLSAHARVTRSQTPPADPTYWWVLVMGRIQPGMPAAQARSALDTVLKHTTAASNAALAPKDLPRVELLPGSRGQLEVRDSMREPIRTMAVVVALVLLVACANVANLLLARGRARFREISVRIAIGAPRARIIRQLLTEGVLLAASGAALGAVAARWLAGALMPALTETPLLSLGGSTLDIRLLLFVTALAAACVLLFALAPALRATNVTLAAGLQEGGRSAGSAAPRGRLQPSLVVVQIGLSMMLVVTAALLAQSVRNLQRADLGFDPSGVLTFRLDPTLNGYEGPRLVHLYGAMLERLRALPGVRGATLSAYTLISNSSSIGVAAAAGVAAPPPDSVEAAAFTHSHLAWQLPVEAQFLPTMGIRLVRGRGLGEADDENSPRVAIVNRSLARQLFQTEDAVGQRFRTGLRPNAPLYEVVGVCEDARYTSMRRGVTPTMYLPYRQQMVNAVTFEVRTDGDPEQLVPAVREAVGRIDPNLPLLNARSQQAQIAVSLNQERLFARLAVLLGAVTVALSAIGLYGLLAYAVTRRTAEIGIRMALGAERAAVRWMILRQSLILAGVGLTIGLGGAAAGTRLVESMLYELPPRDPLTLAGAAGVMLLTSALAGYLPARRASRVDPLVALRAE